MNGALFLVVGNSGSGKDAVIKWAVKRTSLVKSVKRCITREENKESEEYYSIKREEFKVSDYCLSWESYGRLYGIRKDVLSGLINGVNYIVNVSRDALDKAKLMWNKSYVIEIAAPIEILEKRISERKRESAEEVNKRIERAKNAPIVNADIIIDASNSDVSLAGRQLLDYIEKSL